MLTLFFNLRQSWFSPRYTQGRIKNAIVRQKAEEKFFSGTGEMHDDVLIL